MLEAAESEDPSITARAIIYRNCQTTNSTVLQRYRQTYGQTDDLPWQYRALRSIAR